MCDYCGCKTIPVIRQLTDEHLALLDQSVRIRHAIGHERWHLAESLADSFAVALRNHVTREERGVFRAMREAGDFIDEVDALTDEHASLDRALLRLDSRTPGGLRQRFEALVHDLGEHIQREELGLFPVVVVTLGSSGWDTISRAHDEVPTFLSEGTPEVSR